MPIIYEKQRGPQGDVLLILAGAALLLFLIWQGVV